MYQFPVQHLRTRQRGAKPAVILLSCGSFNPVTYGHLRLFEVAADSLCDQGLEVLGFYFSPVSDHYKKKGLLPSRIRLDMLKLSVQNTEIMIDEWEMNQADWTPTVHVIEHMYDSINKNLPTGHLPIRVVFVCGADLFATFQNPKTWSQEEVEKICSQGVAVIDRSGPYPTVSEVLFSTPWLFALRKNVYPIRQWVNNDISSTLIRQCVANGRSIKYLLPDSVIHYIQQNQLYGAAKL